MFKILSKLAAGAVLLLQLAGCQSSYISNGSLRASPWLTQHFMDFRNNPDADYLVVSADGRTTGYSYCPAQRCNGNAQAVAIRSCSEGSGQSCYILGSQRKLLWHYADNIPGGDLARTLCFAALTEDEGILQYLMATTATSSAISARDCQAAGNAIRWGKADAANQYKEERGLKGTYTVGPEQNGYRPVGGSIEVLGFQSDIHGWIAMKTEDPYSFDLYQAAADGGVGPLLGTASYPH